MRLFIILFFCLALDIYIFLGLRHLTVNWSTQAKGILFSLFWSIPIILIGFIIAAQFSDISSWPKSISTYLRSFLLITYLSKILVAALFLIDDIRRVIAQAFPTTNLSTDRSNFLLKLGLSIGSIPFITLLYGMARNAYRYKLYKQTVNIKGLPQGLTGLKIVQISDIHAGSFTFKEPVKRAIELINAQEADLVFFTGDMVNDLAEEMEAFQDVFNKIQAKYGVYSVLGNHDYGEYVRWDSPEAKQNNLDRLKKLQFDMGWNLLVNENTILDIKGEQVAIIGVENYSAKPQFPRYGDLSKAYQGTEKASLKLLLSHDPSHWEAQVLQNYKDINITFSGHTHGFQFGIEIPGWIKWSPVKYVYKEWAGLYEKESQFLYVNRGLGFLGYPGRVGILPEITVMDLQSA